MVVSSHSGRRDPRRHVGIERFRHVPRTIRNTRDRDEEAENAGKKGGEERARPRRRDHPHETEKGLSMGNR